MRTETEKAEELLRIISDLLHTPAPDAAPDFATPPVSRKVESRIAAILKDGAAVPAGHIQIIGLQALKDHLGGRWPEKRAVIHEVLHSIISRRLSPQDVFFQKSEDEFLIVFARLGADAARFVCARILQELNLHFLGNASLAGVSVRTAVGVLDGSVIYEAADMQALLAGFGTVEAGMADAAYFKDGAETPARLAQAWADTSYHGQALADQLPGGLEAGYRPLWDVHREVLSTYAMDYGLRRGNALVPAYQAIRHEEGVRAMDVSLLRQAAIRLAALAEAGTRLLLCLPVHYETVRSPALLHDYVQDLGAVPRKLRQYLLIACDGFPEGVPHGKLAFISHALKPWCRGIAAHVGPGFRDFGVFADTGITMVGCRLPAHLPAADVLEDRLRRFVACATGAGVVPAVLGVDDVASAAIARTAGARFLEGDVIGRRHEAPGPMVRLTWPEIGGEAG
jgi:hypothetical protein